MVVDSLASTFPARGARRRRRGTLGRLDVDLSILDSVDQAPAIRCDAGIESDVDMGLANITTEDQESSGLFRSHISIAHHEEQHAFWGKMNKNSGFSFFF